MGFDGNQYEIIPVSNDDLLTDVLYLTADGEYFILYRILKIVKGVKKLTTVKYKELNDIETVEILLHFKEKYNKDFLFRLVA